MSLYSPSPTTPYPLPAERRWTSCEFTASWDDASKLTNAYFTNATRSPTATLLSSCVYPLHLAARDWDLSLSYLSVNIPPRFSDLPPRITIAIPFIDLPRKLDLSILETMRLGALYDTALDILGEMKEAAILTPHEFGDIELVILPTTAATFFPFLSAATQLSKRLQSSEASSYQPQEISLWNPYERAWEHVTNHSDGPTPLARLKALSELVRELSLSDKEGDRELMAQAIEAVVMWDRFRPFESISEFHFAAVVYSYSLDPLFLRRALGFLDRVIEHNADNKEASELFHVIASKLALSRERDSNPSQDR